MSKNSQNYNVRWQVKIDEKLEHLEEIIQNHVISRLDRLNGRQWKLTFALLTILGGLSITLIMALIKIM